MNTSDSLEFWRRLWGELAYGGKSHGSCFFSGSYDSPLPSLHSQNPFINLIFNEDSCPIGINASENRDRPVLEAAKFDSPTFFDDKMDEILNVVDSNELERWEWLVILAL